MRARALLGRAFRAGDFFDARFLGERDLFAALLFFVVRFAVVGRFFAAVVKGNIGAIDLNPDDLEQTRRFVLYDQGSLPPRSGARMRQGKKSVVRSILPVKTKGYPVS